MTTRSPASMWIFLSWTRFRDKAIPKKITKLLHCVVYGLALGHRWKIELSDYKGIMKLFVAVLSTVGRLIHVPGDL